MFDPGRQDHGHSITAGKLIEVLQFVPKDAVLRPNSVGNLSAYVNGDYVGYVDTANETWEPA